MSTTTRGRRRRYSAEEIEHWLGEQDREGLTYQQLSDRSGIPLRTLASWRRKARTLEAESGGLVELHVKNGHGRFDLAAIDPFSGPEAGSPRAPLFVTYRSVRTAPCGDERRPARGARQVEVQ